MAETNESLLVGVVVNGSEVDAFEIIHADENFLIPLRPFANVAIIETVPQSEGYLLETPLGNVQLAYNEIKTIDNVEYISQHFIEEKLLTSVSFDSSQYAIAFRIPWKFNGAKSTPDLVKSIEPDVRPSSVTLSRIRNNTSYFRRSDTDRFYSTTLLGGRIARGLWRVRFTDDFRGTRDVEEYLWYRFFERQYLALGQQRIHLHPLLQGFKMTGMQAGYSNRSLDQTQSTFGRDQFILRRSRAIQTFRGQAPPGGYVQLRVNGQVISQQQVGLDGNFEFLDIQLPSGQLVEAEIYVFNRFEPNVPAEIRVQNINVSSLMVPQNVHYHLIGIGVEEDLSMAGKLIDISTKSNGTGFYQSRHGLHENVTVETAIQKTEQNLQWHSGIVTNLLNPFVLSASLARSANKSAYQTEVDARWKMISLRGGLQRMPAGYREGDTSVERYDRYFELRFQPDHSINLGLIGREYKIAENRTRFLLPTLNWRPWKGVFFRSRPDYSGDYQVSANLDITSKTRFNIFWQNRAYLELSHRISKQLLVTTKSQFHEDIPPRHAIQFSWRRTSQNELFLKAGLMREQTQTGILLSGGAQIYPGVLARVEYQSIPDGFYLNQDQEHRLWAGITTDLTLGNGGILPANTSYGHYNFGTIAGKIQVVGQGNLSKYNLEGRNIRVNGSTRTQTDRHGNYFLGYLTEDIYEIELSLVDLPIEIVPKYTSKFVQVVSGATTRLDFFVNLEYGVAGQVTDENNRHLVGAVVTAIDNAGIKGKAITNQFGYYRIDALPIGDYTLTVAESSLPDTSCTVSVRQIEIRDDFLFGQDLVVSGCEAPVPPVAETDTVTTPLQTSYMIHFDFDQSNIKPEAAQVLEQVIDILRQNPEFEIFISAHTDEWGSDDYNIALSQRRARAVAAYLRENGMADRIAEVLPLGESQPIAPNDTEQGRALNRRVELILLVK